MLSLFSVFFFLQITMHIHETFIRMWKTPIVYFRNEKQYHILLYVEGYLLQHFLEQQKK